MRPDQPGNNGGWVKPGPGGGPDLLAASHLSPPLLAHTSQHGAWRTVLLGAGVGAAVGLLILHPLTMAIYWFEFHPAIAGVRTVWHFLLFRIRAGFTTPMLPMSAIFAGLGAGLGGFVGFGAAALAWSTRRIARLESELGRALPALLAAGESETLEFKASLRWDREAHRVNRALEEPVLRTITGFMNHRGGTLLLGVGDDGSVVGLAQDYATLRRPSRDGFEQYLLTLLGSEIGVPSSLLVHLLFHRAGDRDVCRVVVEPSPEPVFLTRNGAAHFFVRTGNATRALDPREALVHVQRRSRSRQ